MGTHRTTSDAAESTVADLSAAQQRQLLEQLLREKARAAKRFPMSCGQEGLWHAYRRDPASTAFNVFLPTRIRSPLELESLHAAVGRLVQRHASLRTTFSDHQGQLHQQVHDELAPEFHVHQVPQLSESELRERVSQQTLRAFDLEHGPLVRVHVYQRASDDFVVLALTHHIVTDFWSLVLLFSELRAIYPALLRGVTPDLPPAANNYREFVTDQRALLESPAGEQLARYWQGELRQAVPVTSLITDFLRPKKFSGRAENVSLNFERATSELLTRFAAEHRCTPVAVVQAALQVFLQRISGQESFFVGSPFSGRQHRKYETTTGFFVNMLPLKANLAGDPSFAELAQLASQTLVGALEHEAYPIARIVNESDIPRDPSRSPLFQVSCTFEKAQLQDETGRGGFLFPGEPQSWEFGGLKQESFYVPCKTCHYDLEFIFEHTPTALRGMLCYCRDLFSQATAKRMADNFNSLLQSLLANGQRQISQIPWQHETQSPAVTASPPLAGSSDTVHDLLLQAAQSRQLQTAIRFADQDLSYGDVETRSAELQHALQEQGVEPGDIVPLSAPRGPAGWIGMLGILRAGAAFVPLDAGQPALPLAEAVAAARAPLAVTATATPHAAASIRQIHLSAQGQLISPPPPALAERPSASGDPQPNATNLAYVVYTSGSTGKPKGVMVTHPAVCNTLRWRMRDIPLRSTDRVLMLLSHQFDAGLGIAWTSLTQGATLVMPTEEELRDPNKLLELIVREQITVLPAPPSLLVTLFKHPRFGACAEGLQQVWTGGEAMPADLPDRVRRLTGARFVNFYGPTEAAIEATFYDATEHLSKYPVPIGKPIPGTEILILDERHQPVPDTVPGEIAIGGAGLACGYLNDEALTSLKFVRHPRRSADGERVYLTGDRGRRNAQGQIEFLGRTDHQIKLRGYRLELGEIETVLEAHPQIERAALTVSDEGTAHARLLAFASASQPLDDSTVRSNLAASLRRYLREHLPAYKIPSSLALVNELPMTSSGKVDRSRLPQQITSNAWEDEFVEPATPLEEYLAQAWCQLLGGERISTHLNFFDAGGSSLQAAMLTTSLSEDLGVAVPTALLFDLADISQMAQRLVELHPALIRARFGDDCVTQQQQLAAERADGRTQSHSLLVPLQESGDRRPLFMVHPPGGIVVCYRELANALAGRQPLYGIRSRGLHGSESLPPTLTDMASDYLEAIRSVAPTGPYQLGGWSLGGLVAYEMAQQLLAEGQAVEHLILLDTTIPQGGSPLVPERDQVNVGLEYGIELTLEQLGDLPPEEQLPYLWEHAKQLGVLQEDSPPEVVAKALEELQSLFHHHLALATAYHLQPLDVDVVLFRPQEVPYELDVSRDRGWGHLARDVRVHFVPGHHHSMVQSPHVQELARLVDDLLD